MVEVPCGTKIRRQQHRMDGMLSKHGSPSLRSAAPDERPGADRSRIYPDPVPIYMNHRPSDMRPAHAVLLCV
jgi:hypothetical protein